MEKLKRIALVAHDNRKKDLVEWVEWNYKKLIKHQITCTGTTGLLVEATINRKASSDGVDTSNLSITKLKSGPLGGDQQLGGLIAEGKIDFVIFFWDPLEPHPHDVDVKALLRIAVVYNIPLACNRATADFLISSPLMEEEYRQKAEQFATYLSRELPPINPRAPGD